MYINNKLKCLPFTCTVYNIVDRLRHLQGDQKSLLDQPLITLTDRPVKEFGTSPPYLDSDTARVSVERLHFMVLDLEQKKI